MCVSSPLCFFPHFAAAPFALCLTRAVWFERVRFYRIFTPHWRLKRWLKVGSEKIVADQIAVLNEWAYKFVRNRRADLEREDGAASKARGDLISHFMAAAKKEGTTYTDQQMRDHIINFLLAGPSHRIASHRIASHRIACIYTQQQRPAAIHERLCAVHCRSRHYRVCFELVLLRNAPQSAGAQASRGGDQSG
jgi:hypothetical protein